MIARNLSDITIKNKTGKSTEQWNKIIDQFGSKNHTEIAKFLREKHKVNPWWAQTITNRYEWARGLRIS